MKGKSRVAQGQPLRKAVMRQISVRLPVDLIDRLDEYGDRTGATRARLLAILAREGLEAREPQISKAS